MFARIFVPTSGFAVLTKVVYNPDMVASATRMVCVPKTPMVVPGVILVLIGLLGFISNPLIGENALFATDAAYNLIHIALGAILLVVIFWFRKNSVLWLKVIGATIFFLGCIGIFSVPSTGGTLLGITVTNGASNWLHFIAGIVIFVAGMYGKEGADGV